MQTLYIDVYFLVNFVVDTVSLFFAVRLSRGIESFWRCLVGGILGALVATVCVLINMPLSVFFLFFFGSLLLICAFVAKGNGKKVYFRLILWFLLLECLVGGVVHALYIQLDILFKNVNIETNNAAENRTFLYMAVIGLFGIGAVRLISLLFATGRQIRTMRLCCTLFDQPVCVDCLYDSGNFLTDPISGDPVVVVKSRALSKVLSEDFLCERYESLGEEYARRFRLIPVYGISEVKILAGLVVPDAMLIDADMEIPRAVVLAVDKEEGDFGGYDGLLPGAVLNL